MNRLVRTLAWFGALGAGLVVLRAGGQTTLAAPPMTGVAGVADWIETQGPGVVGLSLVRLGAEVAGWYLLVLSVAQTALVAIPAGRRRGVVVLPFGGRLVRAGLGVGLVAASNVTGASAAFAVTASEPGRAVMQPVAPVDNAHEPGTAWMTPLAEEQPSVPPGPVAPAPVQPTATPDAWTVEAGESFWTIAHDIVETRIGRAPTTSEIDHYWRTLVATNRDRLVDPGNPDLILPGQVFSVPAAAT